MDKPFIRQNDTTTNYVMCIFCGTIFGYMLSETITHLSIKKTTSTEQAVHLGEDYR